MAVRSRCYGTLVVLISAVVSRAGGTAAEPSVESACDSLGVEEQAAFLKAHNDARAEEGLAPLAWSNELGEFAQAWLFNLDAEYRKAILSGKSPTLQHRPPDGEFAQKFGENIAYRAGTGADLPEDSNWAVEGWLEEKAAFDRLNADHTYKVGDEDGEVDDDGRPIVVGHYTQLMWKDHTTCGAARLWIRHTDERGTVTTHVIIVCNYGPRGGNVLGESPF
jgi:hypothetical protein